MQRICAFRVKANIPVRRSCFHHAVRILVTRSQDRHPPPLLQQGSDEGEPKHVHIPAGVVGNNDVIVTQREVSHMRLSSVPRRNPLPGPVPCG